MSPFYYSAFGHRLSSSIPLPELRSTDPGPVRWNFQVVDHLPALEDSRLLGEEPIYGAVSAKLYRHASGHRIVIDDTGAYDLINGNSDIRWQPTEDPWWDFGRSHLIGRVLATSLQLSGVITFHASAVQMADGVIGFLAPKYFGKSTLATMLVRAGARFVTDDSLPVIVDGHVVAALPGIQSLRLRAGDDPHGLLGESVPGPPGRDGKVVLLPFSEEQVLKDASRVSGLYFLRPKDPGSIERAAERSPVRGMAAAVRLMGQTKIGTMLGSDFAMTLLDGATAVAASVPVHDLTIVRGLDRLPEVVDHLVRWHGLPEANAAPGVA